MDIVAARRRRSRRGPSESVNDDEGVDGMGVGMKMGSGICRWRPISPTSREVNNDDTYLSAESVRRHLLRTRVAHVRVALHGVERVDAPLVRIRIVVVELHVLPRRVGHLARIRVGPRSLRRCVQRPVCDEVGRRLDVRVGEVPMLVLGAGGQGARIRKLGRDRTRPTLRSRSHIEMRR